MWRSSTHATLAVTLIAVSCAVQPAAPPSARDAGGSPVEIAPRAATEERPHILVLGTAQDGGLPHVACFCPYCEAARNQPDRRRLVASIAIVVPASGRQILVDATPDIRPQLDLLRPSRHERPDRVDRRPVDGVLLTHAHLGHYTGLGFFGFEAAHTREIPVHCTPSLADYLRNNGPWSQLVRLGNIVIEEAGHGTTVDLGDGVTVTFVPAPHRDEYTDTVGFLVRGPRTSLLYVPDTDSWTNWDPSLPATLDGVDVAILDGTFFSLDELPGRDIATIGHPLIGDTMDLLEELVREHDLDVYFTHLNHSNPALDPDSEALREIQGRGFAVLSEGQVIPL